MPPALRLKGGNDLQDARNPIVGKRGVSTDGRRRSPDA